VTVCNKVAVIFLFGKNYDDVIACFIAFQHAAVLSTYIQLIAIVEHHMLHTLSRLKSYAVCASSTRYTPKNIVACWLDSLQRQSHQTRYSSTNTKVKDVAIIGGGISGLASAYYITKLYPSAKVTIYENSSRLGGWLQSTRHQVDEHGGTVLFESGPRTLRPGGNGLLSLHLVCQLHTMHIR